MWELKLCRPNFNTKLFQFITTTAASSGHMKDEMMKTDMAVVFASTLAATHVDTSLSLNEFVLTI